MPPKLNKRLLKRAAKIYALSNTVHSLENSCGSDNDLVTYGAVSWAVGELQKMGLRPGDLLSIDQCIAAAARLDGAGSPDTGNMETKD